MPDPLRLLLIEDSETDAQLIERALRGSDFEPDIHHIRTSEELETALRQELWDVVLAGYSLAELDGLAALALVREFQPDTPFILVSEEVGEELAVEAIRAGAHDWIPKQHLGRLGAAIRRELQDAEVTRAWQQAEKALHDREALFRSIIENVSDVIVIVDRDGTVRYQSPSVARVLGFQPAEFAGTKLLQYIHPEDVALLREALSRGAAGGGGQPLLECRVHHRNGSWRVLEGVPNDLTHDWAVHGIVFTFRDVTERKRQETERHRAQRLESLGSLASGIAHDLNNLLTPILIAADVLLEEPGEGDQRTLLEGLQVSARRAADVVEQILSFARGIEGVRVQVAPADLLRELERLLRFSLPKSIQRQVSAPKALWPIHGDATQLLQVLVNLCVNARDAMPAGGRLTIDAENVVLREHDLGGRTGLAPGPFVHLRVTDSGTGIPLEICERIFEPFYTTKQGASGTGLGLSTSLSIIEGHGGFVRVYSEPGRGARFSIYVPAAPTPESELAARDAHALPRGAGELVLVVDDEISIREVIGEILEGYGYRTLLACCGGEAIAIQRQHPVRIDLALVDMSMPLMDGPATIRALRATDPDLRVVAQGGLLGNGGDELAAGEVEGFLEKPFTTEHLLQTVAEVLHEAPG